jgi:ABC-2 type transport system permease protein
MKGRSILWLVEAVYVETDSLSTQGNTIAFFHPVNLEDQLFKYGVRINPVLVEDYQSAIIPVVGQKGDFVPTPWLYYPLINGNPEHPITRNLNMIKAEYINTIDTVGEDNIKKTIILYSSNLSRIKSTPAQISISEVMYGPDETDFNTGYLPLGILLEGNFESVFKNRDLSQFSVRKAGFIEISRPAKMIVIADGDIIKNKISQKPNGVFIEPLGYDRYTNQTYGNKDFILNAVNYLVEGPGIIELRSREIELRLLNRKKIADENFKWQLINLVAPCIVVIVFGILYNFRRKQKYS